HANGPADALRRLETMVLMGDVVLPLHAVREQVVSAVDLVVHVARTSGGRRVTAVAEVVDPGGGGHQAEQLPGARVRILGDQRGLGRLPTRPSRAPGTAPPDRGWVTA
ncbi:MAG: hypothetical protein ACRD0U_05700, partial [Acidimicrobiales bacterium]